ncbi:MAG: hypothetical protein ABFS17_13805 [Chloroflexota bacterium]
MSKKSALEWMMWQVEQSQMEDPAEANLIRAIQYFNEKYGSVPNRCELSPEWGEGINPPAGMVLTRSKSVQPGQMMLALDPTLAASLPGKTPGT